MSQPIHLPDRLVSPLFIGEIEVGAIVLNKARAEAALLLQTRERLRPLLGGKGQSIEALTLWDGLTLDAVTPLLLALLLPFSRNDKRNPWNKLVEATASGLSLASRVLRLCPICGKDFRKRSGAGVTCGKRICKRGYGQFRGKLRNLTRDHGVRRREQHKAAFVKTIGASTPVNRDLRQRGITSARAAADAYVRSGTTDTQEAITRWASEGGKRRDVLTVLKKAARFRRRAARNHSSRLKPR